MRFGLNLLLFTSHVEPHHERAIARAAEVGFDGVEIPWSGGEQSRYRGLGAICDRLGLARTMSTGLPADADPIHDDPAVRRKALDTLRHAIDAAHAAGATVLCGPLHSAFQVFRGRGPTDDEFQRSADVLREAAQHAAKAGVLLAPEALNRFECYLVNTAAQMRRLVELVDHPALKAHYDTHHMHLEEPDAAAALRHTLPVLGHVHVSENDRGVPGRGQVAWEATFTTLKESGYDGWVTIEAFSRLDPGFAAAIHIWRDYFADPDEVLTEGLAFVKRHLG